MWPRSPWEVRSLHPDQSPIQGRWTCLRVNRSHSSCCWKSTSWSKPALLLSVEELWLSSELQISFSNTHAELQPLKASRDRKWVSRPSVGDTGGRGTEMATVIDGLFPQTLNALSCLIMKKDSLMMTSSTAMCCQSCLEMQWEVRCSSSASKQSI